MKVRLLLLLIISAGSAWGQPRGPRDGGPGGGGPGGGQGERRGPPPSAYSACAGASEGSACTFNSPRGVTPGSCYEIGGQMACIPADAPRPPGRNALPPGPPARAAEEAPQAAPAALPAATALPAMELATASAPAATVPEPKKDFPYGALLGVIGCVIGALALWRSAPATATVAPPPATKPRGVALPELPDSVPTKLVQTPPSATPPAAAPAPSGEFAKQYEIKREIGVGGMGVVYEAIDLKLDRRVALKKMRPEIGLSASGRDRFLTEAKTVAKLQHQNIVTIHGIIEEGKDLYLVFEYVDGETLDALIGRQKKLTSEQALAVLRGVADAVDYAHEQKVIHRDLKPANIMIDRAGRAKVMDFGIAHQAKLTISQMTMAEAYGTLAYMPPEQELGRAVRESDVYAFAALTYEALVGQLPFPGPNFHLQKEAMSFTRPSFSFPPLAPALDPVFERAFQVEPKKRHSTTGEFVKNLQTALAVA